MIIGNYCYSQGKYKKSCKKIQMCRLLAYVGPALPLEQVLLKPEHSLFVQSYQPREMTSGLLNADGFGVGWYGTKGETPYIYRQTQPIWSDGNLADLGRYVQSGCILANVRSATVGQPVQLSNCQPFRFGQMLFVHNGFIENFAASLYRPLRDQLSDASYQLIQGSTDSEHMFALLCEQLIAQPGLSLAEALTQTLKIITELAKTAGVRVGVNLIISDGQQLVACRYAYPNQPPSLYWRGLDSAHPDFPANVLVVSEPIMPDPGWQSCPENTLLVVGSDLTVHVFPLTL
jgi:ergothioneine biosynthesis protein EgtC